MLNIRTFLARAVVRLAIVAAPADLAAQLHAVLGGGGGPKPVLPK